MGFVLIVFMFMKKNVATTSKSSPKKRMTSKAGAAVVDTSSALAAAAAQLGHAARVAPQGDIAREERSCFFSETRESPSRASRRLAVDGRLVVVVVVVVARWAAAGRHVRRRASPEQSDALAARGSHLLCSSYFLCIIMMPHLKPARVSHLTPAHRCSRGASDGHSKFWEVAPTSGRQRGTTRGAERKHTESWRRGARSPSPRLHVLVYLSRLEARAPAEDRRESASDLRESFEANHFAR